jgi:hypothetical protein
VDPILVLVVAVVAGGAGLIWLARFSRRQSQVLKSRGVVEWRDSFTSWGAPRSFALLFFGPQPKALEHLGIALAVLTAVAVVVSAVAIVVAIYLART